MSSRENAIAQSADTPSPAIFNIPRPCDTDYWLLRQKSRPQKELKSRTFKVVELFSGCGGSALGVEHACHQMGINVSLPMVIDNNPVACAVFQANFEDANVVCGDVHEYFSNSFEAPITTKEKTISESIGNVDLLIGGPPCQGHSDLNNFSRRSDPKNELYSCMARAARVLRPAHIIIENVQGITHDKSEVFQRTLSDLESQGYSVQTGLVDLHAIGVPQRRRRHILVASKTVRPLPLSVLQETYSVAEARDVQWAIKDLEDTVNLDISTTPSRPSKDNIRRIQYLNENNLFDLPNEQRPPCHRDRKQTYNSVYGRLRWDKPSQTITSGFYSMCMGRYVHPSRPRTLTAREAARLQYFPDYFSFEEAGSRTAIAKLIGNAVPMRLSYCLVDSLLKAEIEEHE